MSESEDRANDARRLGLMIVETRTGQALAGAIPHLSEAADMFRRLERSVRRAECLVDLGRVHARLGSPVSAAAAFTEALSLVEDESDLTLAITAASEAGLARLAHGDHEQAFAMLRRAELLADRANDHLQVAQVRHDLARCHIARGDAAAARESAEKALSTFTAFRKALQRSACVERLAEAAALSGDHAAMAQRYGEAAAMMREQGRFADLDGVQARWADRELARGALDAAERLHRERIATAESHANRGLQSHALLDLGLVLAKRQDHAAALATFRQAGELCAAVDDRQGVARADFHIGGGLLRGGDAAEGLRRLQLAAERAEQAGDLRLAEEALAAVVRQQRAAGDHAAALANLRRWSELLRRTGDRAHEVQVLGEIAEVGRQTGDWGQAEQALRDLIAACADGQHRAQLVDAHHHLGVLSARRGDLAGGLDHLQRALALLGDLPAHGIRAQLHYRVGNLQLRLNRAGEALPHLQAALAANPDDKLRPRILVDLGNAQAMLGQDDLAGDLFEQAAKVAEKQGDMRATTLIRRGAGGLKR